MLMLMNQDRLRCDGRLKNKGLAQLPVPAMARRTCLGEPDRIGFWNSHSTELASALLGL